MTLDRSSEEKQCGEPKFYLHDCPFFPRNTLKPQKHFKNDLNYRCYNINLRNKAFDYHRDKLDRIMSEGDKREKDEGRVCEDIYHDKHFDNYKNENMFNIQSCSDKCARKPHESQGNSINHGRGKEKLLNPRKNMCNTLKGRNREGGKHYTRMNEGDLSAKWKSSVLENTDTFDNNDENDFTLSAQIAFTSDIPQRNCKHSMRVEKILDSKHDYQSLTFPNEENQIDLVKTEIVADENSEQPVVSHEYEELDSEKAVLSHRDFVMLQLQEAEEIKKLFSDRRNVNSKIKDLYEEEQFLYDPDSKQVSHIVLTKSRSCNFLEYFKTTNELNDQISPIPRELQILGTPSLRTNVPSEQGIGNLTPREKQPLTKSVPISDSGNSFQELTPPINWKNLMPTEKILIIERKKSLPPKKMQQNSIEYLKVEGLVPKEFQKTADLLHQAFTKEKSLHQKRAATLPPLHKRPELQKRYFYNEFKTYKRKYNEDDLLYADQVKSTKDKFEKIFSKIIDRKRSSSTMNISNVQSYSKENIQEKSNAHSLKRSQRFASEDNICLRKQNTQNVLGNTCSTEKLNEPLNRQNRNSGFYRSLMKIKFTPRKKDADNREKTKSKQDLVKTIGKNTKLEKISGGLLNDLQEEGHTIKEDRISDKNLSQDNPTPNKPAFESGNKTVHKRTCETFKTNLHSVKTNRQPVKTNIHPVKLDIKKDEKPEAEKVQLRDEKISVTPVMENEKPTFRENKSIRFSPQSGKQVKVQTKEKYPGFPLVSNKLKGTLISANANNFILANASKLISSNVSNVIPADVNQSKMKSDDKHPADPYYKQNVIDEIYRRESDTLESFGRPISEEVLIKIRECGTSITYFGGRVINRKYGPMCSPMTMTILNEIKQYMSVLNEHFQKPRDEGRKI